MVQLSRYTRYIRKGIFIIWGLPFPLVACEESFIDYTDRLNRDVRLRIAHWKPAQKTKNDAILITPGRIEFIEMYQDIITNFTDKGYDVYAYDTRGHGKSSALLNNNSHKVHVDTYDTYIEDLHHIVMSHPELKDFSKIYLMGYSMGAHIVARTLFQHPEQEFQNKVKACLLICPMMNIYTSFVPFWVAWVYAEVMCLLGYSEEYCSGYADYDSNKDSKTNMTSDDTQHAAMKAIRSDSNNKDKVRWGLTYGWLRATCRSIIKLQFEIQKGKKIQQPVFIITAENEAVVRNPAAKRFFDLSCENEKSKALELEKSFHNPMIESQDIRNKLWQEIHIFIDSMPAH